MTDIKAAIAAAYADAARVIGDWQDEAYTYDEYLDRGKIKADFLARAAAIAAEPDLIGVEPWSPPPEADRPDGYRCLIRERSIRTWIEAEWHRGAWVMVYVDGSTSEIKRHPTAFAPLPIVKGEGE